jgi:hypothetical protein
MKKVFAVISVLLLLFSLVGCAKEPIEKAQAKIVEIGEQFLDYEITATEAREMLKSVMVPPAENYENGKLYLEVDRDYLAWLIGKGDSYEDIADKVAYIKKADYTR